MNPEQLLNRFSTHLKNIVAKAMSLATSLNNPEVSPLHLFVILLEEEGSIANEILKKYNIEKKYIYNLIDNLSQIPKTESNTTTVPNLDENSKKIIEKAMVTAFNRGHKHVGTEHLLFSFINTNNKTIENIINKFKLNKEEIEDEIENVLQSTSNFPEIEEVSEILNEIENVIPNQSPTPEENSSTASSKSKKNNLNILNIFTKNLTDKKNQKNIDPVIGREKEIERVINILSRRTKNNPVLVGEPGVGKTAIVEGLAKKIIEGDVPNILKNKKILSLDLTMMIAGTIYRGEFESRLKQVIDEITKSSDYILFIDELHNIIGAGSSQGAMDAANILKPALARGSLHCIGATTLDEYKKHISSDPALERRFQQVFIEEPSPAETIQILTGIKKYYEDFHNTKITTEAIESAVNLSIRYVHDNFLPDKAIDLIDEACASAKANQPFSKEEEKKYQLLQEKENLINQKEIAIDQENFESAIKYKNKIEIIKRKISKLEKEILATKQKNNKQTITSKEIAHVLSNKLNIPKKILLSNEWEEIRSLPTKIQKEIIGQDQAIETITRSILQAKLGINKKNKPLASFLFVGPSGVGKTEMAKILAKEMYHDEKTLIKLNMSEFSESHSTSKLLGSPVGYIGHKERNKFTDEIKKYPYSIILFDEIDKAHPDVIKLLLQILDEGELTDSAGKKTYFKHAIIVLTTNLGGELFRSSGIGFTKNKSNFKIRNENILNKLKDELSPAILNRLNNIIIFEPISKETTKKIIEKNLININKELTEKLSLNIKFSPDILDNLTQETYNEYEGVRNIEKYLHDVIDELIINILEQKNKRKKTYNLIKKENNYLLS